MKHHNVNRGCVVGNADTTLRDIFLVVEGDDGGQGTGQEIKTPN